MPICELVTPAVAWGDLTHLSNGVLGTADCQDAFHGTSGVVANSTFGT
jgi:hypothetical protein